MLRHSQADTSRTRAFTLVELLVSVALTAILLWGLLQLFTSATKFSSAVATESELCAAGRALLTRITREVTGAAPLKVGYLKITDNQEVSVEEKHFDSIQFIASVASEGTQFAHVKYGPIQGSGTTRKLGRGAIVPVNDNTALTRDDLAFDDTDKDSADLKVLGVRVEKFAITYMELGSTTLSSATQSFTSGKKLPRAIFFQIRLRDPQSGAAITLQSGAYLAAAGL